MIYATIIGHLTADPIVATRQVGDAQVKVANFIVAANEGFGDAKYTQFFRVALWRGQADMAEKYLRKGRLISVGGPFDKRSYVGSNGQPYTVLEFVRNPKVELLTANNAAPAPVPAPAETETETPANAEDDGFPFEV